MVQHPTYISLDVPEPFATGIATLRRTFDAGYAHLPVEIAIAGSSGVGVITGDSTLQQVITIVNRIANSHAAITTRFCRASWLSDLRVYALEVDAVESLVALHESIRASGLTFSDDVPPEFHPHCTLRWSPTWMNREQDRAWNALTAPTGDFVLGEMVVYALPQDAANVAVIHRAALNAR